MTRKVKNIANYGVTMIKKRNRKILILSIQYIFQLVVISYMLYVYCHNAINCILNTIVSFLYLYHTHKQVLFSAVITCTEDG